MKMTKKILLGAAVALAAVMFSGCDWSMTSAMQKSIGTDMFKYDDSTYEAGLGTWTINETNEDTEKYIRGGKLLLTKHSDIAAKIDVYGDLSEAASVPGIVGLMFDVSKKKTEIPVLDDDGNETDETEKVTLWNFAIAGVRKESCGLRYYVSYFANVRESLMAEDNFGVTDKKTAIVEDADYTDSYEIDYSDGFKTVKTDLLEDGTLEVIVAVDEDETTGDYTVSVYEMSQYDSDKYKMIDDPVAKSTTSVSAESLGKDGAAQNYVGVYANVYRAVGDTPTTLNARVEITDLTNAAVED